MRSCNSSLSLKTNLKEGHLKPKELTKNKFKQVKGNKIDN